MGPPFYPDPVDPNYDPESLEAMTRIVEPDPNQSETNARQSQEDKTRSWLQIVNNDQA